ncbi:class I tRNA ligase family protein [Pantoea agglomerans]
MYFLGFDNSYFWGVTHLALLMAHEGKYILPHTIVPNEFYELENSKFSTSRGHLIWARDLVTELPRDYARFYLCLTSPEHNRNNFSRMALQQILNERLITSWNLLVSAYNAQNWNARVDDNAENVEEIVETMSSRLHQCCRIETFSQSRLADWILNHISRLQELITEDSSLSLWAINRQIVALLNGMGLIMIDLREAIAPAGSPDAFTVLSLPELSLIGSDASSKSYAS